MTVFLLPSDSKWTLKYKNIGLTQEKLAERAALSLDFIGKIEVNINKPGLKSLIKIANALDIHIKDLFNF